MKYIKLRQLNKRLYFKTDDLADALGIKKNSSKVACNRYTITRGGKPIASIGPIKSQPEKLFLKDLGAIIKSQPSLPGKNHGSNT